MAKHEMVLTLLISIGFSAQLAAFDLSIEPMSKDEFQLKFAPILVVTLNELSEAKARATSTQSRLEKIRDLERKGHASIQEVKEAEIGAANAKTRFAMRDVYFRICKDLHKNLTEPKGILPFRAAIQAPGSSVTYGNILLFDTKQAAPNRDAAGLRKVPILMPVMATKPDWQISAWLSRQTVELCFPVALARNEAKVNGSIKLLETLVEYREHRVVVKHQAYAKKVSSEFELNQAKLDLATAKTQLTTEQNELKVIRAQLEQLEQLGKRHQADLSSSISDLPVSLAEIEQYITDRTEHVAGHPNLAYGYLKTAHAWLLATESYHASHRKAVSSRNRRDQIFAIKSASANERTRVNYWAALAALHTQQEAQIVRLRALEFIQWIRASQWLNDQAGNAVACLENW